MHVDTNWKNQKPATPVRTLNKIQVPNLLIKVNRQTLIRTRDIIGPRPAYDISPLLSDLLILPINRCLIWSTHPVPHRRRKRSGPIRLVLKRSIRRPRKDVICEAIAPATAVCGANRRGPIAALLKTDVTVSGAVVVGGDLELDPCGW